MSLILSANILWVNLKSIDNNKVPHSSKFGIEIVFNSASLDLAAIIEDLIKECYS